MCIVVSYSTSKFPKHLNLRNLPSFPTQSISKNCHFLSKGCRWSWLQGAKRMSKLHYAVTEDIYIRPPFSTEIKLLVSKPIQSTSNWRTVGKKKCTCPWVRESIGTEECVVAMSHIALINSSMTGKMTVFKAPFSINAWARLLMSSDVHAKWKNSSTYHKKRDNYRKDARAK